MRQLTFATQPSFEKYARKSRREEFLTTMEAVVPWAALEARIAPHYPKAGKGRQPVGLSVMLRIYFLQHWFALSDPGAEDALYESPVLRGFCGIDLGRAPAPDETTILNFRHLLEANDLCSELLDAVNHHLISKGLRIATGTIVDATIIAAPSSTKNARKERDPQMHQTKKGNQYYFGAKAHIGMDRTLAWCTRCARRQPPCMTSTCYPTCSMARKRRCGAMLVIKGKRKRFVRPHPMRRT